MVTRDDAWDVFISHASEDKQAFVRPFARTLQDLGVRVWYDEFTLHIGDSISRSIDRGLAESRYGIVVLSQAFLRKQWTEYELRGLTAREIEEGRRILPIWHGVSKREVLRFSPTLADKLAVNTASADAVDVAMQVVREVRPDLYASRERTRLQNLPHGAAVHELQTEISRASVLPGLVESIWPMAIIGTGLSDRVRSLDFIALNDRARDLFRFESEEFTISPEDLWDHISRWMEPPDLREFISDQEQLFAKLLVGNPVLAKVPLRFNDAHPSANCKNRAFFPVMLERSRESTQKGERILMCILYIDETVAKIDWQQA
jgi:hypothetical protein